MPNAGQNAVLHGKCRAAVVQVSETWQSEVLRGMAVHRLDTSLVAPQARLWAEVLPALGPGAGIAGTPSATAGGRVGGAFRGLFEALAGSRAFRELWACRKSRGPFLLPCLTFVACALTLADLAEGLAAAAAVGEQVSAALGLMTAGDGATATINSELPPVHGLDELAEVLGFGTVFFNAASKRWSAAAATCRAATAALGFPTNVNVYATAPGRCISTATHADHHDVLVMQTQGQKRWRVFSPPPRKRGGVHPCHRGKREDVVDASELGAPLVDVTLRPGECLFVPAGFVHSTSTASSSSHDEASVHMTLGISAADCGLTNGTLRGQVLVELGFEAEEVLASEASLDDDRFWALLEPLRLGCLAAEDGASTAALADSLVALLREVDFADPGLLSDEAAEADLRDACDRVAERWVRIQSDLVEIYDAAYAEVASASSGRVAATGLEGAPGGASPLFRRGDLEAGPVEEERIGGRRPAAAAAAAAATAAATSAGGVAGASVAEAVRDVRSFCAFLRRHAPETEVPWSNLVPQILYEIVD